MARAPGRPRLHRGPWPWLLALAWTAAFLGFRLLVDPLLGGQAPLIALLAAPVGAAWTGGLRAGAIATVFSALAGEWLFVTGGTQPTSLATEVLRVGIFCAYGLGFSWLIDSRGRALHAARAEHEQLVASQQELRAREQRLREVLDAAPAGMLVVDAAGDILLANREAQRQFGHSVQALQAMNVDALVPASALGMHANLRRQYHGQPEHRTMGPDRALYARRRDGSEFPVQIGLNPLQGAWAGRVLASVLDVSDRREAEAALQEKTAMFELLADNIAQLAWTAEAGGSISWYNRRWHDYTGTTLQDMQGWGWRAVHHPDHLERVLARFRRHMESGEPWEDTFPLRGADGRYRWFLSRAVPLRDAQGRVLRWFGTNTDIEAQREAEQALREADRRKDEFLAMLAHELRNPLAPVRNAVEILRRVAPADPRIDRPRDIIARQVAHMARLVDDLLDVSRIGRGRLDLQRERCDLAALACQTANDYRPSLEAAGQQLRLHGCGRPVPVEGDPVRLAQMLGNLLTNAARFHQGPGTVDVSVAAEAGAGQARIEVADTGMGIEPQLLERLFDPFTQAQQDLARSRGGLGLGLALTRGLAELHGGSVRAASAGAGQGARFTVLLPLAEGPQAARPAPAPPVEAACGALRILVIEDNRDAAAMLGELLQLAGHDVDLAHDGASGLERARRGPPDLVISDLGLPGALDGYAVAQALRADRSLQGIPLLALSGYADDAARSRSRAAGFDLHLAKPPDPQELERSIARLARRPPAVPA